MKKFLIVLLFSAFRLSVFSQLQIVLADIAKHQGDSVMVTGTIFEARYLSVSQGSPTFLNVGGKYPNDSLTLVIWGNNRSMFKGDPETVYINQKVRVSGKVMMYKGRPEIILYNDQQIRIVPN